MQVLQKLLFVIAIIKNPFFLLQKKKEIFDKVRGTYHRLEFEVYWNNLSSKYQSKEDHFELLLELDEEERNK